MLKRIHILGASGSGTTTLAKALAQKTEYCHFDADDYYWVPTEIKFTQKRSIEDRQELLGRDLKNTPNWILSGSLCGWGDIFIPQFELVVYLSLPKDIRLKRLIERERQRYGKEIEPDGKRHQMHMEFIDWASQYDNGGYEIRSKVLHDSWLSKIQCPVLRVEGDLTVEERLNTVLGRLG